MPKPYSNDLRTRVVLAVRSGETCRSVAKRFGVSVASVVKWSQRYRVTGSVSPDKMGGYRRPLLDPHRDFIIEQIERTPHLTLYALKDPCLSGYHPHPLYVVCLLGLQARAGAGALRRRSG